MMYSRSEQCLIAKTYIEYGGDCAMVGSMLRDTFTGERLIPNCQSCLLRKYKRGLGCSYDDAVRWAKQLLKDNGQIQLELDFGGNE
jgi:hypothetical protein